MISYKAEKEWTGKGSRPVQFGSSSTSNTHSSINLYLSTLVTAEARIRSVSMARCIPSRES